VIQDAASWLPEFAVKSTIVLGCTGLVVAACRRLSAAERHLLWACAVAGLLFMPFAIRFAPAVGVQLPDLTFAARRIG
jgi:hypothetical protein